MADDPIVGILMASQTDWETMEKAATVLDKLDIPYETRVISAHRTPARLQEYAATLQDRGLKVLIAGDSKAASLPGALAALTLVPVLGVPLKTADLRGQDSLLSMVQMPDGIPVGTLAIGDAGATNAALLAASILALGDERIAGALDDWRTRQSESVPDTP